jgi:hypothetical protein
VYVLGTIGIDATSSAQSKCGGGGETGGGGCNTAVAGGSEVLVVLKNGVGRETARSRQCWEWLGCTSSVGVADDERGVSRVVDDVANNVV